MCGQKFNEQSCMIQIELQELNLSLRTCNANKKLLDLMSRSTHNRQVTFPSGVGSKLKKGFGYGYV